MDTYHEVITKSPLKTEKNGGVNTVLAYTSTVANSSAYFSFNAQVPGVS